MARKAIVAVAACIIVAAVIITAASYYGSLASKRARSGVTTQPTTTAAPTTSTYPSGGGQAGTVATTTSVASTTISQSQQPNSTSQPQVFTDFIVANPVNLSQISLISKFRSCMGHDYSGYDVQGYQETQRSMKHYFMPVQQLQGSVGKIQEYAPFNGTVQSIVTEQTPVGKQVWLGYTSSGPQGGYPAPNVWDAVFFHLDPIPGLAVGSHVTAGQLIGYANQTSPIQEFDIALEEYNGTFGVYHQVLDSIFNHMSPQVLAQYSSVGINQGDIIISKAYRDANPCDFNVYNPNDSVTLT